MEFHRSFSSFLLFTFVHFLCILSSSMLPSLILILQFQDLFLLDVRLFSSFSLCWFHNFPFFGARFLPLLWCSSCLQLLFVPQITSKQIGISLSVWCRDLYQHLWHWKILKLPLSYVFLCLVYCVGTPQFFSFFIIHYCT